MCWHELWHRLSFRSKSSRRIKLSRTVLTCLYSSPLWYQLAYCDETWSATSGFWVIWWPKWTLKWSFKLLGSFLGSERLHCVHFLLWNFYELLAEILTPEHLPHAKDITLGKEKKELESLLSLHFLCARSVIAFPSALEVSLHAEVNGRLWSLCLLSDVFLLQRKKKRMKNQKWGNFSSDI